MRARSAELYCPLAAPPRLSAEYLVEIRGIFECASVEEQLRVFYTGFTRGLMESVDRHAELVKRGVDVETVFVLRLVRARLARGLRWFARSVAGPHAPAPGFDPYPDMTRDLPATALASDRAAGEAWENPTLALVPRLSAREGRLRPTTRTRARCWE